MSKNLGTLFFFCKYLALVFLIYVSKNVCPFSFLHFFCCHGQRCWDFCWCGEQNVHLIPTLSHSFCFCELNVWPWSFTYSFVLIASKNVHVCLIFVCSYCEQYLQWKKYLVNISSFEMWTTEVVDRGMLVLFEKRTQRTTGTILGWQSENSVFNIMPAYHLAKWISVCFFLFLSLNIF